MMINIPGRIPIRIYPFFWLLVLIIGWINSFSVGGMVAWAIVIFFSVLIHEYGHALTALAFGQEAHIELVGLGGVTLRHGPRLKLWKEFIIVLNGPLAGFLLFLGAYQISQSLNVEKEGFWNYLLLITVYANLFWTVVNLLPIHPLDGGRLLSIILEGLFGIRGVRVALLLSSILAVLFSLFFFMFQAILAGALFMLLAFESYRAWKNSLIMTSRDNDDTFQQQLKNAKEELRQGHEEIAREHFEKIREETTEGIIYITASEELAKILNKEGKYKEAYDVLQPLSKSLSPDSMKLLHQLAFRNGLYKEAAALGNHVYQVAPGYDTALTNALSYALMTDDKPAIGWLQRAIEDGLPNPRTVFERSEFNQIRSFPSFRELEHRYSE